MTFHFPGILTYCCRVYAGITVAVLGAYGFMMGRPDTVTKKGIEHNTDAMHNMIPSDKQRQGGPIRSA